MDEPTTEEIDSNDNTNGSNSGQSAADERTYHFRKGADLDGFEAFGTLFADGLFADLAIGCNGKVFKCHRVVMAASSDYLKSALSVFGGDSSANTVMIMPDEIKVADMEAILHFIYNGQVEVTRDQMESFLRSAKTLHVKGLANIKLVYNNNHNNGNKVNGNDGGGDHRFNHNKRNNCLLLDNRSQQIRNDLNFSTFKAIPQTSSFQSAKSKTNHMNDDENEDKGSRRKQTFPMNSLKNGSSVNGFGSESMNDDCDDSQFITITDEEDNEENEDDEDETEEKTGADVKNELKVNGKDKQQSEELSGDEGSSQMPCLIQIDADPTTFPSYCPASNGANGNKRRRSSSMRSATDLKPMSAANNSSNNSSVGAVINNKRCEQIRKAIKMGRSNNRKLGLVSLHKNSFWSSSKWKCDICNKLYGNKQTLKEHVDYFHSNREEQIFTCTICKKEYTWKKSLMKHYRDIHHVNNSSTKDLDPQKTSSSPSVITNASQNT